MILLAALSLSFTAPQSFAQEPDAGEAELQIKAPSYSEGHVWLGTGMRVSLQSVAATEDGAVVALGVDDAVYRRTPGGSWVVALSSQRSVLDDPGAVDEEQLLMDAEGFLDEFEDLTNEMDSDSEESTEDDESEDDEESQRSSVDDASPENVNEMTDMLVGDERGDGTDLGPKTGGVVWASSRNPGLVLVSRSEGVWRSMDHGKSFSRSGDLESVYAFADGHADHILAGTSAGLRLSVDRGASWDRVNDPLLGIETFSFAWDGDWIFAGTAEGLFRTGDGLRWAKLLSRHDSDVPVWSVAVDPYWDGGLWVTGPVGILRSDDGGQQLRAASRNPLPGTVSLLALGNPGHVLAAGLDGVWESTDGGTKWRPLANGLPSPANHLLVDGPFVGGVDGLYELKRAKYNDFLAVETVPDAVEGADVGTLVAKALMRPGMDMSQVLARGSIARSLLFPKLQLSGKMNRSRYISGDYDARANKGASQRSWSFSAVACFGACSGGSGYSGSPVDMASGSDGMADGVAVVGDEVYGVNEAGSLAPMAANVSERVTRYRTDVAGVVSELAIVRHRLIEASSLVRTLSLREQVTHELDVLESAARLDVYTNGYFSRVLDGS
jgi:hypothetical protein